MACARGYLPSEQGEREGEASSGFAGEGGDASPNNRRVWSLILKKIALFLILIFILTASVKGGELGGAAPSTEIFEQAPQKEEAVEEKSAPAPMEQKNEVQPPAPILFLLKEFRMEGNSLIPQEKLDALLAPFTGDQKGFADIEKARSELEKAYHDAGYPTVLVIVPEQTLENGVVKMEVVESRLNKIEITGNRHFSEKYILKKLPSLKVGGVPYEPDVEKELAQVNNNPDLAIIPVLSPGEERGTVDLQLNAKDRLPLHGSIEWNDKESPNTLRYRMEASVQYTNLFDRDQILTFNTTQTPERLGDIQVYGLTYVIPIASPENLLIFYGARSESASVLNGSSLPIYQGNINISGNSTILGARYAFPSFSGGEWIHQFSAGVEYKQVGRTSALFPGDFGSALISNPVNYTPVSISYNGSRVSSIGSIKLNGSVKFNKSNLIWEGGVDDFGGNPSDPVNQPGNRRGATGTFALIQAGSEFYGLLPEEMAISFKVNGQIASEPLISAEAFFAGGVESVRGYLENEVLGDNGIRGSVEYFFPPLPRFLLKSEKEVVRFRGFLDAAHLISKGVPDGQIDHYSIAGYGIGLDLKLGDYFQTTLDQGWALEEGVVTRRTNPFLHFAVKVQF